MLFPIPIFLPSYPYIGCKYVNIFKNKIVYEKHTLGSNGEVSNLFKVLVNTNKQLLLDNNVPINKIRFVFQPTFTYDIDNNTINPKYDVLLPINGNNGLFANDHPVIEINKPKSLIRISVNSYRIDDNYEFIKHVVKNSKLGVVIMLANEIVTHLDGSEEPYNFSVDSEVIRLINLDEAIIK
jgi:hypothetical protein